MIIYLIILILFIVLTLNYYTAIFTTIAYDYFLPVFDCFKIRAFFSMHLVTFRAMIVAKLLRIDGQVTVATSDPLTCGREKHEIVMQTEGHKITCYVQKNRNYYS